jgi:hypothetical protein
VLKDASRHRIQKQRMMMDDVPGFWGLRYPAAPARRLASDPILEHAGNLPQERRAVKHLIPSILIDRETSKKQPPKKPRLGAKEVT